MKGDFSRSTFDPRLHYTIVRMQQGRVQLDADWNEQMDILVQLLRTQVQDLVGPYGAPAGAAGFAIATSPEGDGTPDLTIAAGRYYVDGILVENDDDTLFSAQPYGTAASLQELTKDGGRFVIYLDVWQRHVTGVEIPSILEPALNGLDTTTRTQTVWQVNVWAPPSTDAGAESAADSDLLQAWEDWRTRLTSPPDPGGQVTLRPRVTPTGFGLSNQLYRVEAHASGAQATFKWSKDNGSRVIGVTGLQVTEGILTATLEASPTATALQAGDWVELEDPVFELASLPAPLFKVRTSLAADHASTTVTLAPGGALSESDVERIQSISRRLARPGSSPAGWPRPILRRWDHNDFAPGVAIGPDGAILTRPGQWLLLENGIHILFDGTGTLNSGDYWLIPARSGAEGYELLWPTEPQPAPPANDSQPDQAQAGDGATSDQVTYAALPASRADHHYAPLAVLLRDGEKSTVRDARTLVRAIPAFQAETASQDRRLQSAVDELRAQVTSDAAEAVATLRNLRDEMFREVARAPSVVYPVSDPSMEIEPGQVVAVDPVTGGIQPATRANASLVVGVTIGPAMAREESGLPVRSYRVAQTGRHECLVQGRVDPGDLLVPSHQPGHAMAAGLYIQPGTVIGKALQSYAPTDAHPSAAIAILVTLR